MDDHDLQLFKNLKLSVTIDFFLSYFQKKIWRICMNFILFAYLKNKKISTLQARPIRVFSSVPSTLLPLNLQARSGLQE